MNPFFNPKKRDVSLPAGCKDLIDVLEREAVNHYFKTAVTDVGFIITACLPGLHSEDIEITVEGDTVRITGKKADSKMYYRHSGYPGGIKQESYRHLFARKPEEVVRKAVKGMLQHNKLGAAQLTKLKIYAGAEHPHQAQHPEVLELESAKE